MAKVDWKPIPIDIYIKIAKKEARVMWVGSELSNLDCIALFNITNTNARVCEVSGYKNWNSFASACSTVRYTDNEGWQSLNAKNLYLTDLAKNISDPKFIRAIDSLGRPKEFLDDVILTVFHTKKYERILIDGTHRGVILMNESINKVRIPRVVVLECYGDRVNEIFPFDFIHL